MTPMWTVLGGAAIVCAVFVVIWLVVHLARRFRREQRGFPLTPDQPYPDQSPIHHSHP